MGPKIIQLGHQIIGISAHGPRDSFMVLGPPNTLFQGQYVDEREKLRDLQCRWSDKSM